MERILSGNGGGMQTGITIMRVPHVSKRNGKMMDGKIIRTVQQWGRNWIFLFIILPSMILPSAFSAIGAEPKRPNVLFIAIDDQNDWIGCLGGHPQVQTPHIDALAKRGTLFTNAHCQAPLCNPSRTSVMTGRRPSSTGIYALQPWFRTVGPLKDIVTLPQQFAAHGYETLMTGKIHHDGYPAVAERAKEFTNWGYSGGYKNLPAMKFVETPDNIKLMDWGAFPQRDEEQDDWQIGLFPS